MLSHVALDCINRLIQVLRVRVCFLFGRWYDRQVR